MDNAFFDYISSSALSLVVSGNTGISPFLTLFVLGVTEMSNPELLNMGQTMEVALASWWSIGILGLLTLGETIGKCIPAIDELIDSAEVFVVPVISVLASLATMGLLPSAGSNYDDDAGKGQPLDVMGLLGGGGGGDADSDLLYGGGGNGDYRLLQGDYNTTAIDIDDGNGFGEGFITFTKVILVIVGIGLSLLIHFFKMLVRVSSLVCSGGCCQPCLTVAEFLMVIFGVLLAIVAPIFAIVACGALLIAAGYVIYVRCCKKKEDENDNDHNNNNKNNTTNSNNNNKKKRNSNGNNSGRGGDDIENQKKGSKPNTKRNTSITVAELPPSEPIYAHAEVISTLPPPSAPPAANPKNNKPDIEATTY